MANELDEKIIYVVVAETVQHPLVPTGKGEKSLRTPETQTIVQVPGRLAAQACHAVRRMGHHMVIDAVKELLSFANIVSLKKLKQAIHALDSLVVYEPITTIILSCRDSFELEHTYNLLRDVNGVLAYKFNDTNPPVYGEGEVTTAFATVPVLKCQITGAIDYLPLWTPKP